MKLISSAFTHNSDIPSKYTCDGENISPPLQFEDVPDGVQTLVLLMHDPDIPEQVKKQFNVREWDHWVLYNVEQQTVALEEGATAGTSGKNTRGGLGYQGPCPPPQFEPKRHRYVFTLYALDSIISMKEGATRAEILKAMQDHILDKATLIGYYQRK